MAKKEKKIKAVVSHKKDITTTKKSVEPEAVPPVSATADISENQELVVRFSDLDGLQNKNVGSSFITDIRQGENEIWFSPNILDKKLVFKTPKSKSGYPETYEFTVSQFLHLLRTKPKNRKATNDELI